MGKIGKKHQKAREIVQAKDDIKSWDDGLALVVSTAHVKFDESIDADVVLGIDPSKGEQVVRGSVLLPHGTGKKVRILVFAKGEAAEKAKEAGADYVGLENFIEKISKGWLEFDTTIATPDSMGLVGKVAKILGPRGLIPNKKIGTVTFDVEPLISDLKKGRVSYRNDKGGVIHAALGKVSFGVEKLHENLFAFVKSIISNRPASAKGKFIKKITISSTMGVGVSLNPADIGR